MVTINGKEYIVDVGYAAPFYKPIGRNLNQEHVIEFGNEKYVLNPRDEKGYSKMEHNKRISRWIFLQTHAGFRRKI